MRKNLTLQQAPHTTVAISPLRDLSGAHHLMHHSQNSTGYLARRYCCATSTESLRHQTPDLGAVTEVRARPGILPVWGC